MPLPLNHWMNPATLGAATLEVVENLTKTEVYKFLIGPGQYWKELSQKQRDVTVGTIFIATVIALGIMAAAMLCRCIVKSISSTPKNLIHSPVKRENSASFSPVKSSVAGHHTPEKLPPAWSKTLKTALTSDDGDCAFHAALGEKIKEKYICNNASTKRKEMVEAITRINAKDDALLPFVLVCIKELIRNASDNNRQTYVEEEAFPLLYNKRKSYRIGEELSDLELHAEDLVEDPDKPLELDPKRHLAHIDFDFTKIKPLIDEYAQFISKERRWLLSSELNIIAHVFGITIYYYNNIQPYPEPNEIYNPNQKESVRVCFNGSTHYERMEDIVLTELVVPN